MSTNVITIDGKRYQVTPQGSPEYMASCAVAQANTALIGAGLDQGPMAARVRLLVERHAALREENARMAKGWAMTAKERDEAKSASGSAGKRLGQVAAERDDAIAEAARQRLRADALATAIRRELDQERAARERAQGKDQAAVAHHTDVISVLCRCARAAGLDEHTPAWSVGQMKAERDAAMTQLSRCEAAKDLLEQERDRARKNWADYKSDLDVALTRIDKAKAVLDRAGVESFGLGLEERIDALAQVCAASDARVAAAVAEASRDLAAVSKRCEALEDERDVARAQAENLRAEMQARIDAVTDERNDLKSREAQARATLQTIETALGAALSNQPGTLSKRVTILIAERDRLRTKQEESTHTLQRVGLALRNAGMWVDGAMVDDQITALASERDAAVARCEDLQKCTKVLVDANLTLQRTMWVVRGEHASTLDDQTSGSGVPLADEQTRAMDRAVYKWAKVEPTAPPRVELVTFADRTRILHHAAPDREVAMTVEDARELWRDLGHALNEADSRAARARNAGEG